MAKRKARTKPSKKKAAPKRAPQKKPAAAKKAAPKPATKKKAAKKKGAKKKAAPKRAVKKKKVAAKKKAVKRKKTAKKAAQKAAPKKKLAARKKQTPARKKAAPRKASGPRKPAAAPSPQAAPKRPLRTKPAAAPPAVPRPPALQPRLLPKSSGTPLQMPSTFLDGDHLPLWFGGYGLSECFTRLGVTTVGELRDKTEEDIREVCGTRDLVRLKARIERVEEKALASELEPPIEETLWPASENFAYFLLGGAVDTDGSEYASTKHVCEIIHRPNSQSITVRLGVQIGGHWQDVTIPLDQLELVSRQHRREELQSLPPLGLAELVAAYQLKLGDSDDRVDKLLHFEFSEFGKSW